MMENVYIHRVIASTVHIVHDVCDVCDYNLPRPLLPGAAPYMSGAAIAAPGAVRPYAARYQRGRSHCLVSSYVLSKINVQSIET